MTAKRSREKQSKSSSASSTDKGYSDGFIAVYEMIEHKHKKKDNNGRRTDDR